jgi:hypothetical protein
MIECEGGETVEKRKLELAFIDKHGKVYQLDDATREDLAKGLGKSLKTSQRDCYC